jgi:hypothetical protein
VTFAGRFLGVFFTGAGGTAALTSVAAGVGVTDAEGLEPPDSAGFGDCFEHALIVSNSPRIAAPVIVAIASFRWREQDESVVPEIGLLFVACFVLCLSPDFQMVVILPPPLRLAQSEVIGQESCQLRGC